MKFPICLFFMAIFSFKALKEGVSYDTITTTWTHLLFILFVFANFNVQGISESFLSNYLYFWSEVTFSFFFA